jgi:hypothetical protein
MRDVLEKLHNLIARAVIWQGRDSDSQNVLSQIREWSS